VISLDISPFSPGRNLKRLLNKLSDESEVMNTKEALDSYITGEAPNYRQHPQVSDYVGSAKTPLYELGSFPYGKG
jgi:hypothetical protein